MASLIPGNLYTTAMGILPHDQVDPALQLALSVDIPFWPQLPHVSYYEDMYVQAGEHFPGMVLLPEKNSLRFDTNKFYEELPELLDRWSDLDYFDISPAYSAVYHRFLELDLSGYVAIRGQMEGPVSFGLKVLDENDRPIIFNDEVRPLLMDFLARRVQAQLTRLKEKHPKAFMFVDEPGLQFVFSSVSGYTDITAKEDLDRFFSQIEPPGASTSAATRIGSFSSTGTSTFSPWTPSPTARSSRPTPNISNASWSGAGSSAGG